MTIPIRTHIREVFISEPGASRKRTLQYVNESGEAGASLKCPDPPQWKAGERYGLVQGTMVRVLSS
jgi:hypothetical protein